MRRLLHWIRRHDETRKWTYHRKGGRPTGTKSYKCSCGTRVEEKYRRRDATPFQPNPMFDSALQHPLTFMPHVFTEARTSVAQDGDTKEEKA
jgi:hypothetical protein